MASARRAILISLIESFWRAIFVEIWPFSKFLSFQEIMDSAGVGCGYCTKGAWENGEHGFCRGWLG